MEELLLNTYGNLIKNYIALQKEKNEKIRAEFFIKLINGEDVSKKESIGIELDEIKYEMYDNRGAKKFVYTILYTQNGISKTAKLIKTLPAVLYNKIKQGAEFYLVFLYGIINFDSGQFWGINPSVYKYITSLFPRTIECFASPFNNNLKDFYSVLYPIDRYYGSKGDFFKEFMASDYDAYVINPPFVETIIAKVQDMITEKLSRSQTRTAIIYYIPAWDDLILPWYESLQVAEKEITLLDINKSHVYDYINSKNIQAKFATYFIYVANYKNDRRIIDKLRGLMR